MFGRMNYYFSNRNYTGATPPIFTSFLLFIFIVPLLIIDILSQKKKPEYLYSKHGSKIKIR